MDSKLSIKFGDDDSFEYENDGEMITIKGYQNGGELKEIRIPIVTWHKMIRELNRRGELL